MRQAARRLVAVLTITLITVVAAHGPSDAHLASGTVGGGPLNQVIRLQASGTVGGGPLATSRASTGVVA